MAFGDNMKEYTDPEAENKKSDSEILESLLNDPIPDSISTNQRLIHEERIRNAPKIVQDYYAGKVNQFDKGLFKVLVARKGNRMIFFVMLFCLLIVFINGRVGNRNNLKVVNGYECELQAFSYDDKVYASMKIHPLKKTIEKLEKLQNDEEKMYFPVSIQFYGIAESDVQMKFNEDVDGKIFLDQQIFRTNTDDYDIITVAAKVKIGDKDEEMSVRVSHKLQ